MTDVKIQNCLFCFDLARSSDEGCVTIFLTDREYWEHYQAIDDCLDDVEGLGSGWGNVMEGCFEYYPKASIDEVKAMLEAKGAVFSEEMSNWINET